GGGHSCWIPDDGILRCRASGSNYGALGSGNASHLLVPTVLDHSPRAQHLSGVGNMCLVDLQGRGWCRGANTYGQLGNAEVAEAQSTNHWVQVHDFTNLQAIETSGTHACSVSTEGPAYCWGAGRHGQIGDGQRVDHHSAVPIRLSPVHQIELGRYTTCAIHGADRRLSCWGSNSQGVLGIGLELDYVETPMIVGGLTGVQHVTLGDDVACAIDGMNQVHCWGTSRHLFWELEGVEVGQEVSLNTPTHLQLLGPTRSITTKRRACAILQNGQATCWGSSLSGSGSLDYAPVADVANAHEVRLGSYHGCARQAENRLTCWGMNNRAQLGNGRLGSTFLPTEVEVDAASHLQTSDHSICVLDSEGQVLCWGENGSNHNPLQVMPEGYDMERVRGIDVD
ncbi:MAG: hypothetical protein VX405_12175, partial [Myxococcota bacterium]|nr:hypothetical protein [Myxococcota bacterium]